VKALATHTGEMTATLLEQQERFGKDAKDFRDQWGRVHSDHVINDYRSRSGTSPERSIGAPPVANRRHR